MKSFWIVLTGRILQMLTAFAALRLMSAMLGPEQMGRLSIIVAATTFFALVFMNPAGMYVNRRLHSWNAQGILVRRLQTFSLFVGAVTALAMVSVLGIEFCLRSLFGFPWPISGLSLALLVSSSLLFSTLNQTLIPSLNLLGHRTLWLIFSTFTLWASLGLSLLFVQSERSAERWQSGQILGFLLGLAVVTPWFLKSVSPASKSSQQDGDSDDSAKRILTFTAPLTLSVGFGWCQFQSYRLFIGNWIGIEELGKFVGVYALIAGLMSAFENLIQQYFYPRLYSESSSASGADLAWRRYAEIAVPTTLIGGLTLLALGPLLVKLMLAPAFHSAAHFILVAAIVETARVISNVYGMAGHVTLRTQTLLVPQALATLLLFVLVPLCFSLLPGQANLAFLISLGAPSLVLVATSAAVVAKKLHLSFPIKVLNPCFLALTFAGVAACFNSVHKMSLAGDIVEAFLLLSLFSLLMIWAVWAWYRNEPKAIS